MSEKIEKFDRPTCRMVREAAETELKRVAERFGLVMKPASGSFTPNGYTFKVEFARVGDDGTALTREAVDFKRYARIEGFDPEALGKRFVLLGIEHTIIGYKARARDYPVLTMGNNGRRYKHKAEVIRARFPVPEDAGKGAA